MPLTAGTHIGPYEIAAFIGAGGMGDVYRARDVRLGRDVAIKLLPESFGSDAERRARFEREAQALAALSHPNIVAIHDTGLHERQVYIVMELLTGQTLREHLAAGAVPLRKAVDIAGQTARGLGAAHGKGLVHRDLKPENVFVLEDGQVKILDFGLAKQTEASAISGETRTVAVTHAGTVMGTVGYMAPEQVRGQPVDARADVFALGAVLYELVSGRRAFERETAADTMTAILTQDPPDLSGQRLEVSPALNRIILRCLEKNPNERFQSARDLAFAIEALSGSSPAGTSTTAADARPARRSFSPLVVTALTIAVAAAGVMAGWALNTAPPAAPSFSMKTFEPQAIFSARFMPDGETIVYSSAPTGNSPRLFELRSGTLEARPFGPPDTHLLSVSSKGELAVLTGTSFLNHRLFSGTLARMTIEGAPRAWLDRVREADWSPDGTTLAIVRDLGVKDQLEYPIGTKLYEANGYLSDLRVSPDGTRVAFMEHPGRWDDRGYVRVVDASRMVLTLGGEFWGEEGLAWARDGSAVFFAANLRPDGNRRPGDLTYQIYRVPADGEGRGAVPFTSPGDFTIHDVAADGRWLAAREEIRYGVVARGAGQAEERDLSWLNKSWTPSLSPDGLRVLFGDGNGGAEYATVWRKTDGSPIVRLGEGDAIAWSPDGKWALAMYTSSGQLVAYPTGAGEPVKFDMSPVTHLERPGWFPDSRHVVFQGSEPGKAPRVYRQAVSGGRPEPILPEGVVSALFLPNGAAAIGTTADGATAVYPLDGGPSRPVPGLQPTDLLVAVSDDNGSLFVTQPGRVPAPLSRIDLSTGARTLLREIAPVDRAGLVRVTVPGQVLKADGSEYAYGYMRRTSTLFVATPAGR